MNMLSNELTGLDVPLWALQFNLTPQQTAFVVSYVDHFEPDRAAREAGFKARHIKKIANQLLNMRKIQQAIRFRVTELRDRSETAREEVLAELKAILDADIRDIFDEQNKIKHPADWSRHFVSGALSGLAIKTKSRRGQVVERTIAIKHINRLEVLDLAMRHLGLLEPDKKRKEDKKLIAKARADMAREDRLLGPHPRRRAQPI
ncbi:Terminase small subunit [Roseivivax lentus]|uniref:Terminase small subunit n=1 Tax=Roseivivax lentus TaxID=633194 RepID=A0A1N7P5W5_9RHOB|nr:terminase small subunit [Roseivivax lentus]SIT05948.1 Terminase small subunit [Roseivivax lentus]